MVTDLQLCSIMTSLLVAMHPITKSGLIPDIHTLCNEVPFGYRLASIHSIIKCGLIADFHTLYNEVDLGGCWCFCPFSFTGNSGNFAPQPQEQRYPLLSACAVLLCVPPMVGLWLPAFGIFNVHTDVAMLAFAHGGCTITVKLTEPALEVDSGREKKRKKKKSLPYLGLEPTSVLRLAFQSDALPTELFSLHPYTLRNKSPFRSLLYTYIHCSPLRSPSHYSQTRILF